MLGMGSLMGRLGTPVYEEVEINGRGLLECLGQVPHQQFHDF